VNGVERDWLDNRNATAETTMPSTPPGRLLFEYIAGMWERNGESLETITKELFPLVMENVKKSDVENASEFEATSIQQAGLHVDSTASNLAVSHRDNMLGTTFLAQNAENGSETPGNSSVAPSGTEAIHNSKAQSKPDHQYTSLLWEYGNTVGVKPQCESTLVRDYPILWSCTMTFNEKSAEGQGRSVREAKHEACRKLCNDLGLD